jgi:preprotein translocase subunit SecG
MQLFITILHIVLATLMILIILLQPGKEGGAALAGGSSGNQMYGPRGAGNFLGRATTIVASMFMFTSISLAWYSSDRIQAGSNIEDAIERLEGDNSADGFGIPMPSAPAPTETLETTNDAADDEPTGNTEAVGSPAGEQPSESTDATPPSDGAAE